MLNRVFQKLGSLKLTVGLLAAIALACIAGTLIPQGRSLEEYISLYGERGLRILHFFWLTDLFESFWFQGIVAGLTLNLLAVLGLKMHEKNKDWRFILIHLSLVLLIAGGFLSGFGRVLGKIKINEGESADFFSLKGQKKNLGFTLRLDDFHIEHYPPEETVRIEVVTGQAWEYPAAVGKRNSIPGTGYEFEIKEKILNPEKALHMQFYESQKKSFSGIIRAQAPGIHFPGTWFKVSYTRAPLLPKAYISRVRILNHGQEVMKRDIRVNAPLHYKGFSVYQSNYDTEKFQWTEFEVVKDPGVLPVFAGAAGLLAGLFAAFYGSVSLKYLRPAGRKNFVL